MPVDGCGGNKTQVDKVLQFPGAVMQAAGGSGGDTHLNFTYPEAAVNLAIELWVSGVSHGCTGKLVLF